MYFFKSIANGRPYMSLVNLILVVSILYMSHIQAVFTLILDPSDAPRQLAASFAKGATMQCAEKIKKNLENDYSVNVIITRTPGLHSSHESNVQMSNRLRADLYVHLSFFQETSLKPHWYIYRHSYGNESHIPASKMLFCPYELAHCVSQELTISWAQYLYDTLQKSFGSEYCFIPCLAVPCAPLIGITAPAFIFDIGLHTAHSWQQSVIPLCNGIGSLIKEYIKQ